MHVLIKLTDAVAKGASHIRGRAAPGANGHSFRGNTGMKRFGRGGTASLKTDR